MLATRARTTDMHRSHRVPGPLQEVSDAQVLGWCIEWLQAFFLVSDDIMDDSTTRRGQPCWYKAKGPPCKGWEEVSAQTTERCCAHSAPSFPDTVI